MKHFDYLKGLKTNMSVLRCHVRLVLLVGFSCTVLSSRGFAQQIAFTWDDVPAHSALPPGQTRTEIARAIIPA
jgi:hypothetical protein